MNINHLFEHEIEYFTFAAEIERASCCTFLWRTDLRNCREVNRSLYIRDDGSGPDAIARYIRSRFAAERIPCSVEIDLEAEQIGVGAALRRLGILPTIGSRVLMCAYQPIQPIARNSPGVTVREVLKDSPDSASQIETWLKVNLHEVDSYEHPEMWHSMAKLEAMCDRIRLYTAYIGEEPVSTATCFSSKGMSRIEMVETRHEFRRRGAASEVVRQAVNDAFEAGSELVYLFTDEGGDAARLYQQLGFAIAGKNVFRRHISS